MRGYWLALGFVAGLVAGPVQAAPETFASAAALTFCEHQKPLSASEQDTMLHLAAAVRDELEASGANAALISRSGLDLSRFGIRYSHAAIAWRDESGVWSARQLYYACDEGRPRIYDQGIPGFVMGIDDAHAGYVSIVKLPEAAAQSLRQAALDSPRALRLLAASYSANAYAFSLRYQNCNQWVIELMAVAWANLADGEDLRERAQNWLRNAPYLPEPVDVGSHWLMFASNFVPLLHLDDHPEADRFALKLRVSLPSTVESFARERLPVSERVELCHNGRQIVVHRGWRVIAEGCRPDADDRVMPIG